MNIELGDQGAILSHSIITPSGSRLSYVVYDAHRPVPRCCCKVAFPFEHTGQGKRLVPFAEIGDVPPEIEARSPTEKEYLAFSGKVLAFLDQTYTEAA